MFMLFDSAYQVRSIALVTVCMFFRSADIGCGVAGLFVGMLLYFAGQVALFIVAAFPMCMLFRSAGKLLTGAAFSMDVLFLSAGKGRLVAAFAMRMDFRLADEHFLLNRLALFLGNHRGFCLGLSGRFRRALLSACRLFGRLSRLILRSLLGNHFFQPAYQHQLCGEAFVRVLMLLMLFQAADQVAFAVVAILVVRMDCIIRIAADQLCPGIALLILRVAILYMLMHLILAVQDFHLVRHGLAIQFQGRDCTESDYHSQAQENCQLAFILFVFL
nr:hypothetical protein [uncultured Acetatifactor sp.]